MINLLFWNVHKKPLTQVLNDLVQYYKIDVLILCESVEEPSKLLDTLNNSIDSNYFDYPISNCNHIQLYTRFPSEFCKPLVESNRFTIRHMSLPGVPDLIIVAIHFVSKINTSDNSQAMLAIEFVNEIIRVETSLGHSRTLVVGDLNMNPFEDGMISANGFHAVMSRDIALRLSRIVQGKNYPYFYNPMWGLFGDSTPGPAGTIYVNRSEMINYFWNMYDQILIRPELIKYVYNEEIKIISNIGDKSLLKETGEPDENRYSDHLPIYFSIHI